MSLTRACHCVRITIIMVTSKTNWQVSRSQSWRKLLVRNDDVDYFTPPICINYRGPLSDVTTNLKHTPLECSNRGAIYLLLYIASGDLWTPAQIKTRKNRTLHSNVCYIHFSIIPKTEHYSHFALGYFWESNWGTHNIMIRQCLNELTKIVVEKDVGIFVDG